METRDLGGRIAAAKREIRSRSIDGVERRFLSTTVETRDAAAGWVIDGLGIVYNSLSENLGGFREMVMPGAADGLLDDPDIWGLFNHNPDLVLGRTGADTMRLVDTDDGVRYEIDGSDISYANDLRVSLQRGDVTRSSFAFRIAHRGDEWIDDEETGGLIRKVHQFSRFYDFSPVTYAAYADTDAGERTSATAEDSTAPVAERTDDGPAGERVQDGGEQDQQAGTSARDERAERLRIRIGEPPL